MFYFNKKYLLEYNAQASPQARKAVPGSAYIEKVLQFVHITMSVNCLWNLWNLRARKKGEGEEQCVSCVSWTGLPANRVPQPVPDPDWPFHFMHVAVTLWETESGLPRPVDDWQPRANITNSFNNDKISLQHQDDNKIFWNILRQKRVWCCLYRTSYKSEIDQVNSNKNKRSREKPKKRKEVWRVWLARPCTPKTTQQIEGSRTE